MMLIAYRKEINHAKLNLCGLYGSERMNALKFMQIYLVALKCCRGIHFESISWSRKQSCLSSENPLQRDLNQEICMLKLRKFYEARRRVPGKFLCVFCLIVFTLFQYSCNSF